jgi:hypothetical protein
MGYTNNISGTITIDAKLTNLGKRLLLEEGKIGVSRWRAFDSEINYNLMTSNDINDPNPNIDNIPILNIITNENAGEQLNNSASQRGMLLSTPMGNADFKLLAGNNIVDNPQYAKNPDISIIWSPEPPQEPVQTPITTTYSLIVKLIDSTSFAAITNAPVYVYKENMSSLPSVLNTDADGKAIFQSLESGKGYTIVPKQTNIMFSYPKNAALLAPGEVSQSFKTVLLSNNTTVEFGGFVQTAGTAGTYSITGIVTNTKTSSGLNGVQVVLSDGTTVTTTGSGKWGFWAQPGVKAYSVSYHIDGYKFDYASTGTSSLVANTVWNTNATPVYRVIGKVYSDVDKYLNDAVLELHDSLTSSYKLANALSKGLGDFTFDNLEDSKTYNIIAYKDGYIFRGSPTLLSNVTSDTNVSITGLKTVPVVDPGNFRYPNDNRNTSPIKGVHCEKSWYYFSKKWSIVDYFVRYEPITFGIPFEDIYKTTDYMSLVKKYLRGLYRFSWWTRLQTSPLADWGLNSNEVQPWLHPVAINAYEPRINDKYEIELSLWRLPYQLTLTRKEYDLSRSDTLDQMPSSVNTTLAQTSSVAANQSNNLSTLNVNGISVAPGVTVNDGMTNAFANTQTQNLINQTLPISSTVSDPYSQAILAEDLDTNMISIHMNTPSDPAQRKTGSTSLGGYWWKQDSISQSSVLVGTELQKVPVDALVPSQASNVKNINCELLPMLVIEELWESDYLTNNIKPIQFSKVLQQKTLTISQVGWRAPGINQTNYTFDGYVQRNIAKLDVATRSIISVNQPWFRTKFNVAPTGFYQILELTENTRYGKTSFAATDTLAATYDSILYDSSLSVSKINSTLGTTQALSIANGTAGSGQASLSNPNQGAIGTTPGSGNIIPSGTTTGGLIPGPSVNTGASLFGGSTTVPTSPQVSVAPIQNASNADVVTVYQSLRQSMNSVSQLVLTVGGNTTNLLSAKVVTVTTYANTPVSTTQYIYKTVPSYKTITMAVKSSIFVDNYNEFVYSPASTIDGVSISGSSSITFDLEWDFNNPSFTTYWNKIMQEAKNRQYVHYLKVRLRDNSSQTTSTNLAKVTADSSWSSSAQAAINWGDEICFIIPITKGGVIDADIIPITNTTTINRTSIKSYGRNITTGKSTVTLAGSLVPTSVSQAQETEYLYIRIVDVGAMNFDTAGSTVAGTPMASINSYNGTIRVDILYKRGSTNAVPMNDPLSLTRFNKILAKYDTNSYIQDITDLEVYLNKINAANDLKIGRWVGSFFGVANQSVQTPQLWDTTYLPQWEGTFDAALLNMGSVWPTIIDLTQGNTVQAITQIVPNAGSQPINTTVNL